MELKGDMNLQISDATQAQIKIALAPPAVDFGSDLQFKQHPKVAKFGAERVIALALRYLARVPSWTIDCCVEMEVRGQR